MCATIITPRSISNFGDGKKLHRSSPTQLRYHATQAIWILFDVIGANSKVRGFRDAKASSAHIRLHEQKNYEMRQMHPSTEPCGNKCRTNLAASPCWIHSQSVGSSNTVRHATADAPNAMRNRAALIFNSFFRCLCPCNPLSQTTLGTWQRASKNGSCACCQHRVKCTKLETTKPGKPSKSVAMHQNVSVDSTSMYEAVMVMQRLSMLFSMQDSSDTTKLREQETTYAKQKKTRLSPVKQCELTSNVSLQGRCCDHLFHNLSNCSSACRQR